MRKRLRALRSRQDDGVSLVEVLITTALMVLVSTLLVSSVVSSHKLFRKTDNEATGEADVRTTIERLGRDIRNARSLDAGASRSQLVLWIDSNSDYVKQSTEVVTWSLVTGTNNHFDVARTANGVTSRTARLVISQLAFRYQTSPGVYLPLTALTLEQANSVRLISSDILYAADATRPATQAGRHTEFTERLRNVP